MLRIPNRTEFQIRTLSGQPHSQPVFKFLRNSLQALARRTNNLQSQSASEIRTDINRLKELFSKPSVSQPYSTIPEFREYLKAFPPKKNEKLISYLKSLPVNLWSTKPHDLKIFLEKNSLDELTLEEMAKNLKFNALSPGSYPIKEADGLDCKYGKPIILTNSLLKEFIKHAVDSKGKSAHVLIDSYK